MHTLLSALVLAFWIGVGEWSCGLKQTAVQGARECPAMLLHRPKVPDISAVLMCLLCGSRGLSLWSKFHVMMSKPSRSLEKIRVSSLWVFLQLIGTASCYPTIIYTLSLSYGNLCFLMPHSNRQFFLPLCITRRTTTTKMQIIGYTENKTPKRNTVSFPFIDE